MEGTQQNPAPLPAVTFAEAAYIGSLIVTPAAYTVGKPGRPGDLIAMAAVGINKRSDDSTETINAVISQWPWLAQESEGQLPCGHNPRSRTGGYGIRAIDRISHQWDQHVFGDRALTLENLLHHINNTYENGRAWFALPHSRAVTTCACGCTYPSSRAQTFAENCANCHIEHWTRRKRVS